MTLPPTFGLLLLAYLFILLPLGAWKSKRRFDALRAQRNAAMVDGRSETVLMPTPAAIYVNTLFNMGMLLFLAVMAGREVGYDVFHVERFGARELIATLVWFATSFGVGLLSRVWRSEKELRAMPMMDLVPRTRNDWIAFVAVAIAAGVCEEAAYRGMGFEALRWWMGGSVVAICIATLLSALAFTLAHAVQGAKSMAIVFAKALLMQGLVLYTGTLVGAMVGHALLDLVTGYRSMKLKMRFEADVPSKSRGTA